MRLLALVALLAALAAFTYAAPAPFPAKVRLSPPIRRPRSSHILSSLFVEIFSLTLPDTNPKLLSRYTPL